jgi:hypothetical protein
MIEYRVVTLTPGQMAPEGSTGVPVGSGIMWTGVSGAFPTTVALGTHLPGDMEVSDTYDHRVATEDEIYDYLNPPETDDYI